MQDIIQRRIESLREELAKGQLRLQELDRQQRQVHDTVLCITGAIQVLEELLRDTPSPRDAAQNANGDYLRPESSRAPEFHQAQIGAADR